MWVLQLTVGDKIFFPRRSTERDPNESEPLGLGTREGRAAGAPLPSGPAGNKARKAEREARSASEALPQPRLESGVPAIQPAPQFSSCSLSADSPPPTLTPTPGPASDSAPGPPRTQGEAAEKAARTLQLGCPIDCLTSSFKETNCGYRIGKLSKRKDVE